MQKGLCVLLNLERKQMTVLNIPSVLILNSFLNIGNLEFADIT